MTFISQCNRAGQQNGIDDMRQDLDPALMQNWRFPDQPYTAYKEKQKTRDYTADMNHFNQCIAHQSPPGNQPSMTTGNCTSDSDQTQNEQPQMLTLDV